MSRTMHLDLHIIQTVPPSCVNRDDTGSPKTAVYGGTMRARVSSQAWKRSMRMEFKEIFSSNSVGYRTKNSVKLVADKMCEIAGNMDEKTSEELSEEVLSLAGVKPGSDKKDVLFFISAKQVQAVAELALEMASIPKSERKKQDKLFKEKVNLALMENPSVDILLFGRMAASNPALNYDAAAQVAHSISTHTISNEYDYFTAVDDCSPEDNTGAGHLGTVEFNSSTLYRYATLNVGELSDHLEAEELGQAVKGFAEAIIRSMPTGKQNTFANRTLPDMVYVTVRSDQPVNLAGAFEKPVMTQTGGYAEKSKEELIKYAEEVYENYVSEPTQAWVIGRIPKNLEANLQADKVNLKELLDKMEEVAAQFAADRE